MVTGSQINSYTCQNGWLGHALTLPVAESASRGSEAVGSWQFRDQLREEKMWRREDADPDETQWKRAQIVRRFDFRDPSVVETQRGTACSHQEPLSTFYFLQSPSSRVQVSHGLIIKQLDCKCIYGG